MFIRTIQDNIREVIFASPNFMLESNLLYLTIHVSQQILVGEEWKTINKLCYDASINNTVMIEPETRLIADSESTTSVPAFDHLTSLTAAQIGMTDLNQPVYVAIANQIESFLQQNDLIPETVL